MSRKVLWFWVFLAFQAGSISAYSQSRSPLIGFADGLPSQHWTYLDSNGHAYDIYWTPAGGYGFADLTAGSHAPPAAADSSLTGFADYTFSEQHWAYLDDNGHAYNVFWSSADGYRMEDVTAASNAPPAAPGSPLTSFADSLPSQHWAYFDSDGHMYNIFWTPGGGYGVHDATFASRAPAAAPDSPLTSFADSSQHWAYFGIDGDAYHLSWDPGNGYRSYDASVLSSAPAAAPGSALTGSVGPHLAYFGSNGHLYDMYIDRGVGPITVDRTIRSGAPPAAPGSPLTTFRIFTFLLHWTHFDSNGHAHDILWDGVRSHGHADVTVASGASPAAPDSPLTSFTDSQSGRYWAYLDGDGHVNNIFLADSRYGVHDVTAASGAPPAR